MSTKFIDQLSNAITDPNQLVGSELFVVSQPDAHATTGYRTKKMTLDTLYEYAKRNSSISGSVGYEIYDMSEASNDDYIYNYKVSRPASYTHRFEHDCEILLGVHGGVSRINDELEYVKIDSMPIHTTLLALGEIANFDTVSNFPFHVAKFFVKAGQTLSIDLSITSTGQTTGFVYDIIVNSRPLKQGGDFFFDTSVGLVSPFTKYASFAHSSDNVDNDILTFTAPRRTLFCWAASTNSTISVNTITGGSYENYYSSRLKNNITLNGKMIPFHIHFGDNSSSSDNVGSVTAVSFYNYDRLVLDTDDVLEFDFSSDGSIRYCALPLL